MRFNTPDPELPKFTNEARALALAASAAAAPEVMLLDTTRRIVPWDAIVTRRLPGGAVADGWLARGPTNREALARAAGVALARLHGVSPPGFGDLLAPRATWREAWGGRVERAVAAALREMPGDSPTGATRGARRV